MLSNKTGGLIRQIKGVTEMGALKSTVEDCSDEYMKNIEGAKEKSATEWLYTFMVLSLEIFAFFDLLSDIYILIAVLAMNHTAWGSLTLYTMLSPYLISYIPLINF